MPGRKKEPRMKAEDNKKKNKTLAATRDTGDFYIVGMGASAGGLEAFERFFQNMSNGSGMGFIPVPHLDPTHVSLMPELIQKSSKMSVFQIKNGVADIFGLGRSTLLARMRNLSFHRA